ncbi:MAG TPA: hypothetical protein VF950_00995 [Planctomycetota bacterium]
MIVLALALLAQVRVEKVERVAVDVPRPLSWAPLAITLRSVEGFKGDLKIRSRFGFTVVKRVDVPRDGFVRELVPALDPDSVEIGGASVTVPRPGGRADLAVAVDARLPYADQLVSGPRVRYSKVAHGDLRKLLEDGMMDGVDLLLLSDAAGLDVGAAAAWVVAPALADAERAVAAARRAPQVEAVDGPIWELAPEGGWVPAKRSTGVLFAAAYAFGAFALLAIGARRGPRTFCAAAAVAVLAGAGAYAGLFPRGQVWVEEIAVDVAGTERRIWFVGAATPAETAVSFPRLAKPVFRDASGAERPFALRVEGRGCAVEALALGPGARACFASMAAAPASDLRGPEAPVSDPLRGAFERFFGGRAPALVRESAVISDVTAVGLADARRRARLRLP